MEIGKEYLIIYDDKGFHPVKKQGIIKNFHNNLFEFEDGEILNSNFVIRAEKIEGGKYGNRNKIKKTKTV